MPLLVFALLLYFLIWRGVPNVRVITPYEAELERQRTEWLVQEQRRIEMRRGRATRDPPGVD